MENLKAETRAGVLVEALPYLQEYNGKIVVVKYGGNAMINEDLKQAVIRDIVLLNLVGVKVVLVHGGGPEIGELLKKTGKESKFIKGLRYTDKETMEAVQMVLCGKLNKNLVTLLKNAGGKGVGISGMDGGLFEAVKLNDPDGTEYGYVGDIVKTNPQIVLDMLEKGKFDLIFLLDNKISRPDMVTAREYPVDISFFCASGHPLASQKDITLEQLLQEPFILTEKGCNYREVFESEVAARGQTLTCITEIGYTRYIIQAVSRRLGIGLLPAMTLSEALRLGTISLIQVQNYQIRMSIQVIYSNKRRISLPLRAFLVSL